MPLWFKAASIGGTILVILALVVTLLKGLIAFVGFLTGAVKLLIVLAFILVFGAVVIAPISFLNTSAFFDLPFHTPCVLIKLPIQNRYLDCQGG
jgi:hypothetical protein